MDKNCQLSFSFLTNNGLSLVYVFPKKVTLLITARQNIQYDLLNRCDTLQLSLLFFRFVAFHYNMKFIAVFFFFKGFQCKAAKKAKEKRNHYSVIEQNALSDNYMKNIIKCLHPKMTSQNDRQDESLTGQALYQAGHCPLTGRYFEP